MEWPFSRVRKIFFRGRNFQENPWNSAEKERFFAKFQAPKFEISEPEKMQFHTPSHSIPPLDSLLFSVGRYGFPGFLQGFVSTTGVESLVLRFSKSLSFSGGSVRSVLRCFEKTYFRVIDAVPASDFSRVVKRGSYKSLFLLNSGRFPWKNREIQFWNLVHYGPSSFASNFNYFGIHFGKSQEGCGGLRGESPEACPKPGPIFQQPFSSLESAQTLSGIAFRAAGKSGKKLPAASTFTGRRFQGMSDLHSLLEFSDHDGVTDTNL